MEDLVIDKKTVLKCDVCGNYHDENECEIVTIKVIKGKKCDLNKQSFLKENNSVIDILNTSTIETSSKQEKVKSESKKLSLDDPNVVKLETPEERKQRLGGTRAKVSAVPPAFLRNQNRGNPFMPPEDPRFEKEGAKSFRKI